MYHFVHKKNKELAVRLNHALENMAAEGRIDTIIKKTFEMLLGGQQGNL
jgi:ABC-type amino acid transport substrate-binding protein